MTDTQHAVRLERVVKRFGAVEAVAGVVIAAAPLLILLVIFQKQLVRGLTAGAVKG